MGWWSCTHTHARKHVKKILWQNVHILQSRQQDIINCIGPKIMWQNINISLKSWPDIANVLKKILWQNVNISLQESMDMTSQSILRRLDIMSHVTNCPPRSQGGQKYLDGSYRCQNVTVENCHSRRFVGWTYSLGQIVTWSVCGWTDRQGTAEVAVVLGVCTVLH